MNEMLDREYIVAKSKLSLECPYCYWIFEASPPDKYILHILLRSLCDIVFMVK
jgi:hypothetical protein